MLAKIITLLFICCLSAPDEYLCPPEEEGPRSVKIHDDDIGVADNFVGEYPDFVTIQKQEGTSEMLSVFFDFLWESIIDMLFTTLWTLPAVTLIGVDLAFGELLDNTDALHEERLMEQSHLAIVRPQTIMSERDGLVALSMLHTLEYILERQVKIFHAKSLAKRIMADLQSSSGSPVDKSDLQRRRLQLRRDEIFVKRVAKQMKLRVKALQEQESASRRKDLEKVDGSDLSWVQLRWERNKIITQRNKQVAAMRMEVDVALMPKRIHLISTEHAKIAAAFDGRLYSRALGRFAPNSPVFKRLKQTCYFNFCAADIGSLKTNMSRKKILLCKHASLTCALVYLLACTFYIFLCKSTLIDRSTLPLLINISCNRCGQRER